MQQDVDVFLQAPENMKKVSILTRSFVLAGALKPLRARVLSMKTRIRSFANPVFPFYGITQITMLLNPTETPAHLFLPTIIHSQPQCSVYSSGRIKAPPTFEASPTASWSSWTVRYGYFWVQPKIQLAKPTIQQLNASHTFCAGASLLWQLIGKVLPKKES